MNESVRTRKESDKNPMKKKKAIATITATLAIVETSWLQMITAIARKSRVGMDPKNKPSANILINGANFPNMAVTNQRRSLVACYFIIGHFHITDKSCLCENGTNKILIVKVV